MSQPVGRDAPEVIELDPELVEVKKKVPKGKKAKLPAGNPDVDFEVPLASTPIDQPSTSAEKTAKGGGISPGTAKNHPPFLEMIQDAIKGLKERSGSSRQAIQKYIIANYSVDPKVADVQVKRALRGGVGKGLLTQVKGTGASGSFKINKEHNEKIKKAGPSRPKKMAPKKAVKKSAKKSTPKKAKIPAAKKAKKSAVKKPRKPAKKPTPKKSTTKKPKART